MHVVLALLERAHQAARRVVAAAVVGMGAAARVLTVEHLLGVGSGYAALVQAQGYAHRDQGSHHHEHEVLFASRAVGRDRLPYELISFGCHVNPALRIRKAGRSSKRLSL